MMRPADIPEDVFDAAQRASIAWLITAKDGIYRPPLTEAFARAILAERERAAQAAWGALDAVLISETGGTHLQDHVYAAIKGA